MKKVAFYTLGCKLNYSETSTISRLFESKGFKKVEFEEGADVYIINTCSVTDHADKKCRKVVKEALKYAPDAFVAIIGCYAQLKPKEIAEIPGVDAVLGAAEKFQLIDLIGTFEKKPKAELFTSEIKNADSFQTSWSQGDRTRAFLKVQDGCDYSCTFCTIPLARGESRSDLISNVVENAEKIAATGVREIVLTGVNIGDFGLVNGERVSTFYDLVKALDQVEGIERFRISSIEPNLLSEEIIRFVAASKKFLPHFHIPLQSGSNKVLKLMRRRYQRELYADRIAMIKEIIPECCIGVDVITGFPGETDQEFLDTYNFINNLDVSYLHVFTYSERANTQALTLSGKVPGAVRNERTTQLRNLSEKKKRYFYEQHLNKNYKVLFESDIENGKMFGFTENYIKVGVKYDPVLINEVKELKLVGIAADGTAEAEETIPEMLHH